MKYLAILRHFYFIVFIYCVGTGSDVPACVWMTEDKFQESLLSFHQMVTAQIHVIKHGNKHIYPPSHPPNAGFTSVLECNNNYNLEAFIL